MFLAVLLLGESFTWVTGLGTFFVLLGIYLIMSTRMTNSTPGRIRGKGIILALNQRRRGALQLRKYNSRSLALALTSGLIDYGVGMVFFIIAIQLLGAGKTVVLSTTSALFLLPFPVFILKERLTRLTLIGIFVGVAGICLVAI